MQQIGLDAYVRRQLQPEKVDDAAAEKAVEHLDTLTMSPKRLGEAYFADIRRFLGSQMAQDNAEEMKLRYGVDMSKVKKDAGAKGDPKADGKGEDKTPGKPAPPTLAEIAGWDAIRCVGELQQAKLVRAAVSERQLQEVMVDFWSNHFNVDIRKDACRAMYVAYDRDAIRPHAMGRFRALLGAVAHSPAMLTYLDNQENSVDRKVPGLEKKVIEWYIGRAVGIDATGAVPDHIGPNENYARELLELHTLGVDGGYTQEDVQEVARCFSGWGVNPFNGKFGYDGNKHDRGQKVVLGQVIPAGGGEKDGEKVLDLLAAHPSTAKFISRKLCRRLVSDDPPAALVDRAADAFTAGNGDIRKTIEAIVTSPEFYAPRAYRAKVKSPFEYAVSAVRATDGRFVVPGVAVFGKVRAVREGGATLGCEADKLSGEKAKSLNWHVYDMGQPLYAHAAPTGYPEVSSKWVSPGALIARLNFALALTGRGVTDVEIDPAELVKGADADQPAAVLSRAAIWP